MRILLHTCCAPCSVACVQTLRDEGYDPTALWYNPNIHPHTEYTARFDALTTYARQADIPIMTHENYGLRPFLASIWPNLDSPSRCEICYRLRLSETARLASEHGFHAFSTTLLISPYQDNASIRTAAEAAAETHKVQFLYRDFRPLFRTGQTEARRLGLYMQKYCGCLFSEEERYIKSQK